MNVPTTVGLLIAAACTACTAVTQEVVVGLAAAAPAQALEAKFWNVATPGETEYLRFLSRDAVSSLVGASEGEVARAVDVLRKLGAVEVHVSPLKDFVSATFPGDIPHAGIAAARFDFAYTRPGAGASGPGVARVLKTGANASDGDSYSIGTVKKAFGIPTDLKATNDSTLQMVWGPGTFGYSESQLITLKLTQCPLLNLKKIKYDTKNHGKAGGDNFGEGSLDVSMITTFGLNVETVVSNTNTSSSTEEGSGFGLAMLDFLVQLPTRAVVPQVLSISLGSLSAYSCDLLCTEAVKMGHSLKECQAFMQDQRQVCMYMSEQQVDRINTAFKVLALRGVTVFGSSGDGGSHWSFQPFPGGSAIGRDLNTIGCKFQFPVFPTGSPYVTSVGGITWGSSPQDPVAWSGSGGGFAWQFPRPVHQDAAVSAYLQSTPDLPDASSYNGSNRAYPDISAVSVEGTSQSSPMVAGIFSLVMDHRLNNGLPPLGFLGPRLYEVMGKYPGEAFHDVTEGNSKTTCRTGFPATKGWDPVTGWGSPVWDGLLKHFGADTTV